MPVSLEQLEEFIAAHPDPEPPRPIVDSSSEGPFTVDSLGDRLQAWADANPEFSFSEGRTSKGPGFYIRCPGDVDGWADGAVHGDKVGNHSPSAAVWVENGFPRFSCRHAHCSEGAAQGKKTWKDLQNYYDAERKLHTVVDKGDPYFGSARNGSDTRNGPKREDTPEEKALKDAPWFFDANDFLEEKLPARAVLASDENDTPLLYAKSLNQVFAFRGQGKTMFTHGLVRILVHGGNFLRYKSRGGFKVLIADGELPDIQLQERIQKLIGRSPERLLSLMSPDRMPSHTFPSLSNPVWQDEFLRRVDELKPDVIVLDTLTACFKFDTNDADTWLLVNQFFISLRIKGYCVIVVHHAGKSGTQRGRTDGDDNLDLSIKLDAPKGWTPGDGLEVIVSYEKVRAGGNLPGFQAAYQDDTGKWVVAQDESENDVFKMLMKGKSIRSIATSLDITTHKVWKVKKQAEKNGVKFPEARPKGAEEGE